MVEVEVNLVVADESEPAFDASAHLDVPVIRCGRLWSERW